MDKNVAVERLYSLGDYRNIKFVSVVGKIEGIPSNISSNPDAMALLWYLQLLEIEEARHNYDLLSRKIAGTPPEEISAMLEEERTQTYLAFMKEVSSKTKEE